MIEIKNLNIQFKNNDIVKGIDFKAYSGKVTLITGKSGSGKSSILSFIGCLDTYPCECYLYDDIDMLSLSEREKAEIRRTEISFVFQDNSFISNLTVKQNLVVFAQLAGQVLKQHQIIEYLQLVGLNGKENEIVSNLSGGEKQRLSLICAILKKPKVLIGDEITNSVDEENELLILQIIRELAVEQHICVIIVSHSNKAKLFADDIYEIKGHRLNVIKQSDDNLAPEITKEKKRTAKHSIKEYMRKNNLMHNWKYRIVSLLASFLLLFSFSLWFINQHKMETNGLLMLKLVNMDRTFELSDIEELKKEKGIVFVDYFYEEQIGDVTVQSYDSMQQKKSFLNNNELLMTAKLAEMWNLQAGDEVHLDGYAQSFYLKNILDYPIYSSKVDLRGKYIYMKSDNFANSMLHMLIVYIDNFEDYSQFCDKMRNSGVIVQRINESDFASQFEGNSFFQKIQQGSILGITVVFMVLNLMIEIYIFSVNLRDFAVLKANGISKKDILSFFKEKIKKAVLMEALICGVIVCYLFVFNISIVSEISVFNFIFNLFILICLKHLFSETLEYSIIHIFSPFKLLKITN